MRALLTRTEQRSEHAEKRRKRFPFYLLLSCIIHATLIILLAILFARKFVHVEKAPPPPEVTLVIPPPSPNDRPTVTATEVTDKPPENAPFQSDQNSKAASELPPDGSAPLPIQQGVSLPALELKNQKHTAGEKPATQAGKPAPPQQASPVTPPSQKTTQKTTPKPPEKTASPTPSPTPSSTPPPNNLKLLQPPDLSPRQPSKATQSPSNPSATSAPGSPGATKGYQPETRQTVIRGNISNRGRSSVAAEATPIGRYKKAVADAIGSRWYYYVDERMGLLSIGTVDVAFKVTSSGKVSGLHVVRSNGNESLTDCSLRSIMDAKLPPIPPDVVPMLQNGCLEIDYSFTIY
jgi:outer membrane biosynthesis protein TonB